MKLSIGVDLGGTNTCIGVVTPDGAVHERTQLLIGIRFSAA